MKIKPELELRNICGEYVIVSFGLKNIDFSSVISFNETAACLWNALVGRDCFTIDDMVKVLTDEYEVEADVARRDCEKVVEDWREAGLME